MISMLQSRRDLDLENLLLRQQVAVMKQTAPRPRISAADRQFWVVASRFYADWRS